MTIIKAVAIGTTANEHSKQIVGSNEVSAGRTAVTTGTGVVLGEIAGGTLVIAGFAAAPVTVPLVILGGAASFIASLFA
jgi:uncharacterized membrane protein YphA (DoxX/SURF4 family)